MRERIAWHAIVLVAFVLAVGVVTRWSVTRPIRALIRGAESLGRGEPGQRIPIRRRDEIGRLTEAFNRMAADLELARANLLRQASERLRLEQDVQQAQKLAAVGRLATELAHEIGTPLNVIAGRAEGLQRLIAADHPGRRHLELIQSQADRIGGILRTLLDYSRPRRPVLDVLALTPVIGLAAELLLERFRAKEVRVRLDLPAGLPPIRGDAGQLQQVFLNLLVNALDAAPPGTVVRVSAGPEPVLRAEDRAAIRRGQAPERALAVHVVDGGGGIPAERLPHIFQPFFSTKRRQQGAGLGLPIVEEIVRAHHGAIEVASAPSRGTEVTVWLPVAEEAAPVPSAPPGRDGGGSLHATEGTSA
jgi:signal transduction histidine kinase